MKMKFKSNKILKGISLFLCFLLCFQQVSLAEMAVSLNIAGHLASLHNPSVSDAFRPLHLRYLSFNPTDNNFQLLLDKGDFMKGLSPKGTDPKDSLKEETTKLMQYFLIGLTLPNDTFWVNLRPDSPDQIIDDKLAQTDIGRIMLETDLQLKKDTASFTSPQTPEGREYWDKLYKKAGELYGTDTVTIPTLTRPWIVPGEIIIRETTDSAYIYKATLKVCLEQDYLKNTPNAITSSVDYSFKDQRSKALNEYSTQLIKELILPKLTKEVNSSKRYASLRQVYYSLIMAQWFKARFKGKQGAYYDRIDKQDLTNLTSKEDWSKSTYFNAYKQSFAQGEYNIQEPHYTPTGQAIRSYFSGGEALNIPNITTKIMQGSGPPSVTSNAHLRKIKYPVLSDTDLSTSYKSTPVPKKRNDSAFLSKGSSPLKIEPTRIMLSFFNNVRDKSKIDNPLGVAALGGTLKYEFKDTVHIIMAHQLVDDGVEGIIKKIMIERPEILGLSLGFGSFQQMVAIMEFIRSLPAKEKPIVVLGNVVATYNAELFLRQYPEVFICTGQGEMAMIDIVKYRRGEIKKNEMHDVIYMEDGQIIAALKSQSFLVDMGTPMTDFLPDVVESGGVVYMETSRGCPFNCAICARRPFLGIGWKGRNLDSIISDMENAARLGVRFINFVDEDLFAGGTERVVRFAQMVRDAKDVGRLPNDLIFGTSASVRNIYKINDIPENNLKRKQNLQLLKKAGLAVLFIGIESGAPNQLKRYGKAATIKENEEAIKIVEECGIWTIPGFIMLDPLVTIDEVKENIAFLRRTGMDARITYPLKTYIPMIGSPYTQKLIDEGLVDQNSYIPDRLAYEYSFKDKKIAEILKWIKDWEESQAMFFWELKIIFRSSRFGELSQDRQELVRRLIDEQTIILLDYLDEMVSIDLSDATQAEVLQNISSKFGVRLINDMLEALHYVENGYLQLGGEEFKSIIHSGIVREMLRLYFEQKQFTLEEIKHAILEKFSYDFKEDILKEIFARFIKEERIRIIGDKMFCLHEKFFVYRDIPWPDLPRSAKLEISIDYPVSSPLISKKVNSPGGIDFRSFSVVNQAVSNLRLDMGTSGISNLKSINLNDEWLLIERMINAGIKPSSERIKEYTLASCVQGNILQDKDKIIVYISDMLRQEEYCDETDPILRDILVVLDSVQGPQELEPVS